MLISTRKRDHFNGIRQFDKIHTKKQNRKEGIVGRESGRESETSSDHKFYFIHYPKCVAIFDGVCNGNLFI